MAEWKDLGLFDFQYFLFLDTRHIVEAHYGGSDEDNKPTFYTSGGITVANSSIVLWCSRSDLLNETSFHKAFQKTKFCKDKYNPLRMEMNFYGDLKPRDETVKFPPFRKDK